MSVSKIFFYFCLSFILGIFLSSVIKISQPLMLGFLIFGLIFISSFWPFGKLRVKNTERQNNASEGKKKIVMVSFCLLFLILGIWRHQIVEVKIMNNELRKFNDLEQTIILIGAVIDEPDIREKSTKLIVNTEQLTENKERKTIKGKVLVTTSRYPEYRYGDKLKITGKLETPPVFEGFDYKDYLKKDGIYSVMSWPEIELLGKDSGSPVMSTLFSFKNKFQKTCRNFISPPQEGILEALLFGDEENISSNWKEKLNLTGTRHITAVSGMNITILSSLLLSFLLSLGFWRQQAFYLSISFLILYVLMIGAPSSAVRAAIMAGILMFAQYLGRVNTASRAVVFAAVIMLIQNPLLLRWDVGFQLSFLAILGMIHLQPFINEWFKRIPNYKLFPLRTTLSTTIAAQIFTFPILIYNFGYVPLISPLTNVLIVPFLAPITISIFIFGMSAMVFWAFGWILSWPIWLFLTYIVGIVDLASKYSFASLTIENVHPVRNILTLNGISNGVHWIWLIVSYLILGIVSWRLKEGRKLKFLKY